MSKEINTPQEHFADISGVSTRYFDEGEGSVILLLHGGHFGFWVPVGVDTWSHAVSSLAQDFRVVALDKLGQGKTGLPARDQDWTFDAVVNHAKEFIRHLQLENVTVVGHSRGGLLASKLALDLPDVVTGLCIVSSATMTVTASDASDTKFYDDVRKSVPDDATPIEIVTAYFDAQWVSDASPDQYIAAATELYKSDMHQKAIDTLPAVDDKYWTPSLESAKQEVRSRMLAGEVAVPIQVIWGREDRSAPAHLGFTFFQDLVENSSWTTMSVLSDAGHNVVLERPNAFHDLVRAHANRCS